MTRSTQDRINDIRAAVDAIRKFEQSGRDDGMVFDAVRMRLLEIGEAVNGLPVALRDAEPDVPWKQIIGMRNCRRPRAPSAMPPMARQATGHGR